MAGYSDTYFRATLTGRSTRTTSCAGCACVYQASVERTAEDTGGMLSVARTRAARRLAAALTAAAAARPCPECGLVPPAAVARTARFWHCGVWLGAAIATSAVGGLVLAGRVPLSVGAVVVPGLALVGVLLHLTVAAANPNRRRAANLLKAQADVAAGTTEILMRGRPGGGSDPRAWTGRQTAGVALAAVAPLALLAPAYFEITLDLPTNPHLRPAIVSPGEHFVAPFSTAAFRSVNGWWSATSKVEVLNAATAHAPPTLSTFTRPAWGGGIQLFADGAVKAPTDLHVVVSVPDDSALEGQTLRLRATLNVVYPARITKTGMDKDVATVTHEFPVVIAGRAQHRAYTIALLVGAAACLACAVAGAGLLAAGIGAVKRQVAAPAVSQSGVDTTISASR
jgi:hypothetical protein